MELPARYICQWYLPSVVSIRHQLQRTQLITYISSTPHDINDILTTDLDLTTTFLRMHPKVYWIWNHRRWCLNYVPDTPEGDPLTWKKANWAKELKTVEKMLDVDARNCMP